MEVYLFILVLTIIFVYMLKQFLRKETALPGKHLPGPKPWPVLGNMHQVDTQHLHQSVSSMVKDFGAIFQLNLMGQKTVFINDPELIRKAFGSSEVGDHLNGRPTNFVGKYVLYNCSDLASCNDTRIAMTLRKAFKRAMTIYGHEVDHFEDKTQEEMKRFLDDLNETNGQDFDIYQVFGKSVANTYFIFLTGTIPREDDSDKVWQMAHFTDMALEEMNMFVYNLIPIVRFLPGRFGHIFRLGVQARDMILERCYFNQKSSGKDSHPGFVNAFRKLISETDMEVIVDEENIKGTILDVIIASIAATTTTLTNLFAILMVHQHVAKRIQNEIHNAVEKGQLPRLSDQDKMPYTMATVHEILRYTSAIGPLGFPHLANNDVLFEGYKIEKGSVVLGNLWYVHHDPKLWDDPWIFKPERFLDADSRFLSPENEVHRNFLAFSAGRRNCLGEIMAKSRLFLYLATVLQSYDITLASEGVFPDIHPRNYIPAGELRIKNFLCRALPAK